jgi:hypothetical protein
MTSMFACNTNHNFRHQVSRPSLRANGSRECAPDERPREAIQLSFLLRYGLLRCARNDDGTHLRDLAACFARGLACSFGPLNSEGAGNAGRPMRPIAACAMIVVGRTRVVRSHRKRPAFPAQWFTAYNALYPVTGLFATVAPEKLASRELDASAGASGPHDFAVRLTRRSSKAHQRPPHPVPRP